MNATLLQQTPGLRFARAKSMIHQKIEQIQG
jgi:hypothetical protein